MNHVSPCPDLAARPHAGCFPVLFLLAGLLAIRATQAAGLAATNYIAQWNGSSWSALGSGMNGGVSASGQRKLLSPGTLLSLVVLFPQGFY